MASTQRTANSEQQKGQATIPEEQDDEGKDEDEDADEDEAVGEKSKKGGGSKLRRSAQCIKRKNEPK